MSGNVRRSLRNPGQLLIRFNVQLESRLSGGFNVSKSTTISELKDVAELATGIISDIQRLHYLDRGELADAESLKNYDVVHGATLTVGVWHEWKSLIDAVLLGDIDQVFHLGVTADSSYSCPRIEYMQDEERRQWFTHRGFTALFLSVHRNQDELCRKLLKCGIDVNQKSSSGRCPLHVAAAVGHETMLKLLLDSGADISIKDRNGMTAMELAKHFGHKSCEQYLKRYAFDLRAKNSRISVHPMFAHQYFDSSLKPHLLSNYAQMYVQQILPPGEFEGSGIDSPKRRVKYPQSRASSMML